MFETLANFVGVTTHVKIKIEVKSPNITGVNDQLVNGNQTTTILPGTTYQVTTNVTISFFIPADEYQVKGTLYDNDSPNKQTITCVNATFVVPKGH